MTEGAGPRTSRYESPSEYQVLDYVRTCSLATSTELSNEFGVAKRTVRRRLTHLEEQGKIEHVGENENGAYLWDTPRQATTESSVTTKRGSREFLTDDEREFLTTGNAGDSTPARRLSQIQESFIEVCLETPFRERVDEEDVRLLADFLEVDDDLDAITPRRVIDRLDSFIRALSTQYEFLYDRPEDATPAALQVIREGLNLYVEDVADAVSHRQDSEFDAHRLSRFENGVEELSREEREALVQIYRDEYRDQQKNVVSIGENEAVEYVV